ncbi:MAG: bifunctional phosphopantothenoylcysteine decarboxylase/phosphopantothenate--cysteine ligase CoaBC [Acidobacteria bacterium]|nr:bifunctional phosphopantothenoylcysteine decarboxylase/phosphopantothenate--cysteine ligase CoaBC [Acidobacteriota bacterium]MDA1236168.1 bifunctional phosphopantothenoylcysteine decarboxylase/phosphopantothenate--cysteine ligase CoaBC [Acidobacteriota bacterium]
MPQPGGKRIVLGVSGGIAAYKAAELCRRLQDRGFSVRVVMTASAQKFVMPLTFAALTGERVITDLFASDSGDATLSSAIDHIGIAQEADLLLVAPATADILAKFTHGIADDFLTTMHLAYAGRVLVAPAMNSNMWAHPATAENIATLRARGVHIVEPDAGELACGMVGPGRLAEPDRIADAAELILSIPAAQPDLAGKRVLITAGPTREPIDPVRYISNRSSGKMGFALAAEARDRGASVTIVCGPASAAPPSGCKIVPVETAQQMYDRVMENLDAAQIVVMAAAVADYRPASVATQKIKKDQSAPAVELEPTQDILKAVGASKDGRILVGFAAETENLQANAERKLRGKNCDLLVANLVGDGLAFDTDDNQGLILSASGEVVEISRMSKRQMAGRIFDEVLRTSRATIA